MKNKRKIESEGTRRVNQRLSGSSDTNSLSTNPEQEPNPLEEGTSMIANEANLSITSTEMNVTSSIALRRELTSSDVDQVGLVETEPEVELEEEHDLVFDDPLPNFGTFLNKFNQTYKHKKNIDDLKLERGEEEEENKAKEESIFSIDEEPYWKRIGTLHPQWAKVGGADFGHLVHGTLIQYKKKLVLFGGYDTDNNEFNKHTAYLDLNDIKAGWTVFTDRKSPSPRDHHTSLVYKNKMIVFGGNGISADYLSDTYILDLDEMVWEEANCTGPRPTGRSHHGAFIKNDKMYIHGGRCMGRILNSVACLDLIDMKWSRQQDFFPRINHYLFVFNDMLYSYGGFKTITPTNEEGEAPLSFLNLNTSEKGVINIQSNKAPKLDDLNKYTEETRMPFTFASFSHLCYNHLLVVLPPSKPNSYLLGIWSLDLNCFSWTQHLDSNSGYRLSYVPYNPSADVPLSFQIPSPLVYQPHFTMSSSKDKFYLIGANKKQKINYLGSIFEIDISEYGLIETPMVNSQSLNFKDMFNNPDMADFYIYSEEKDEGPIPAHRFLLCTRWLHFKELMASGLLESTQNHMTIPESHTTVLGFLYYLYTDSLDTLTYHTIAELLELGTLYKMNELRNRCTKILFANIEVENVAHIYYMATKADVPGLKKRAIKFMFDNFGEVTKTEAYRNLPHHALIDFWENIPRDGRLMA